MNTFYLASVGNRIEVEICKSKKACFNNISKYLEFSKVDDNQIPTAFLQLHDQIQSKHVSVSAAGCFEINLNLIGLECSVLITLGIYALEFLLYYS